MSNDKIRYEFEANENTRHYSDLRQDGQTYHDNTLHHRWWGWHDGYRAAAEAREKEIERLKARIADLERDAPPDPIQAARDAVIKAAGPCRDRMKEKATQSGVYAPFCEAVDALRALERPDPLLEAREAADALADAVRRVVKTWPMGDTAKWRLATAIEAYDKAIAARGGE